MSYGIKYRKIDNLYWQVESDWLEGYRACHFALEVLLTLREKDINAIVEPTRHREICFPHQFLIDVLFENEADEAEFIMKESPWE